MSDEINDTYDFRTVIMQLTEKVIVEYYGLEEKELFAVRKKLYYSEKRYIFFHMVRRFTASRLSLSNIGLYCKKAYNYPAFDHASVLHGIKRTEILCDVDDNFNREYQEIFERLSPLIANHEKGSTSFIKTKRNAISKILNTKSEEDLKIALKILAA